MPLIHRVTFDMFEFADVVDYQVNPVNLMGAPGAGLALEFRRRIPDDLFFEKYRLACKDKSLRIGTVQILEETGQTWGVINFPTKRHYADQSDEMDIRRGLQVLRETLQQDKYRYASIGMPMLGCGLGAKDYETVYPMMIEHLGNLDATIFLSMSPDRTPMRPRYLTIAGPMDYGTNSDECALIDEAIDKVMAAWGVQLSDYDGIVSGGYPGVDTYIAGAEFAKDTGEVSDGHDAYKDTFVYKRTGKKPLVVKPNALRNGVGSNLHLGNLLCEIGDDVILIKPKGHNNNRLSAMQVWLEANREARGFQGLNPKRVAIFGEKENNRTKEDVLIAESDLPY